LLPEGVKKLLTRHDESWHLLLTVGQVLRHDDGVGPYIASQLGNRKFLRVIDAGASPERVRVKDVYPGPVAWLVIIDAADFDGKPGEIRLIPPGKIPESFPSTHTISWKLLVSLLSQACGLAPRFIGIQPGRLDVGEGFSPQVKQAADEIVSYLRYQFPRRQYSRQP